MLFLADAGATLRRNDPLALKEFILKLQSKAGSATNAENSELGYDTLLIQC